ncbi:MAG: sugar phosphate nucleotidyltransferase [Clostridiaceae bacterium]
MKGIIMAGGEGSRLRPLTCNLPKPMMPMIGKPVMQYAIELLKKYGIRDIGVTLQYLPDEIQDYFGDGSELDVRLRYFIEDIPLGTAGSVKNAEDFLDETFIVISGDALTDINLKQAMDFHKEKGALATIVLKEVSVPLEYGVVVTDKNSKITGFLEKPRWNEVISDKANTGIYILEPEIFSFYERHQKFDFSNNLFPILLKNQEELYGYVSKGYWCDIGSVEQYVKCNYDILSKKVDVEINGNEVEEGIWIGEGSIVSPKATLNPPLYIGSNCKIYEGSKIGPFTSMGRNNIISSQSHIKRSVIFDNCYLGTRVELKGAVLCNKVQMESRSSAFEESSIGDETLICSKATINSGVRIWPQKVIDTGAKVNSNIIWGGRYSKSIFAKKAVQGEVNVDITPEFVSKLGSAYGSILPVGSKIAISCTDYGAPQMFKYALATGLLSIGVEVLDLKRLTSSITRQTTRYFGVQGGIHVMTDKDDPQKVRIKFINEEGLNIDTGLERKIENILAREDFRRVSADSFEKITHYTDCIEYYVRNIINNINTSEIRKQKYKVIIGCREEILLNVFKKISHELQIDFYTYDSPMDIIGLSKAVISTKANMGIYLADDGEDAILVDDKGNIIKESLYEALKALIVLKTTTLKTYAAPVTSSMSIEKVVSSCGAEFVRTKTSHQAIIEGFLENDKTISRKKVVEIYLRNVDSLMAFFILISYMANNKVSLNEIMKKIPQFSSKKKEVICPWDIKSKLMRTLIEESENRSVEFIEGVKLNYDNSWGIVLLDEEEPLCRVFVESEDPNILDELLEGISSRVERIIK